MDSLDPCRGCVCVTCAKSEKLGNVYGCPRRRCQDCSEDEKVVYKLQHCDDVDPEADTVGFTW